MSEHDTPPSGSRWEPVPGQPDDTPTSELAAHPAPPVPPPAAETLDSGTAPVQPRTRNRGRVALAGAGLALLLGGGLGGFAIGHAAGGDAGDGGTGGTGVASVPDGSGTATAGDGDGDHHGFGGQPPQGAPDGAPDGDGPGSGTGQDDDGTGSET